MSKPQVYFVTGTDTEVGKTRIAAGMLAAAAEAGMNTAAVKPIAAGCDENGLNEDALQLQAAMTHNLDYAVVNPVALQPAIAPHIAAEQVGVSLSAADLAEHCQNVITEDMDFVLVEGAGGWRVPLSDDEYFSDIARQLQVPVVLVVAMRLGCINHAMLTVEAVLRDGLELAGWVANTPADVMSEYAANLKSLSERIPAPLLGEVPRLDDPGHDSVAKFLDINALFSTEN